MRVGAWVRLACRSTCGTPGAWPAWDANGCEGRSTCQRCQPTPHKQPNVGAPTPRHSAQCRCLCGRMQHCDSSPHAPMCRRHPQVAQLSRHKGHDGAGAGSITRLRTAPLPQAAEAERVAPWHAPVFLNSPARPNRFPFSSHVTLLDMRAAFHAPEPLKPLCPAASLWRRRPPA